MGDDLRCGFCLEKLTSDVNAKQLPCSHVYCSPCLEFDEEKVCPACRRSWSGVALGELRSYPHDVGAHGGSAKGISCDLCKSGVKRPSTVYCVSCSQTFCQEHEMKHDELFDFEHDKVSVSSYMSSPARYKKMKCAEHQSEIAVACDHCHLVFCGKCDLNTECKREPKAPSKEKPRIPMNKYIAEAANFLSLTTCFDASGNVGRKMEKPRAVSTNLFLQSIPTINASKPALVAANGVLSRDLFKSIETTPMFSGFNSGVPKLDLSPKPHESIKALTVGPGCVKFSPVDGTDNTVQSGVTTQEQTKHFCITSMRQYEAFSLEELRLGDYLAKMPALSPNEPTESLEKLKLSETSEDDCQQKSDKKEEGKNLHKFVDVAQFTAKIAEELRKKLDILSDKRTDIYTAEKKTWREVDDTESRVKIWENQLDDIIKQKMQQLAMMKESFKSKLKIYSTQIGDQAAMFMGNLVKEEDQLTEVEKEISEALSMETDVTKLVKLLQNTPTELSPTAQFCVQKRSVQFAGFEPAVSLGPFFPTALDYRRKKTTAEAIVSLAAINSSYFLVALTSNHLEIQNLHFCVLFREKVPGQVIDVAALDTNIACLMKVGEKSIVYLYSHELKNATVACEWRTCLEKELLGGLGNKLMVCHREVKVYEICNNEAHLERRLNKLDCSIRSICVSNENTLLVLSPRGIEKLSPWAPNLMHKWFELIAQWPADINYLNALITPSPPWATPSTSTHTGVTTSTWSNWLLSKSRDDTGFFYISYRREVIAFQPPANLYRLTHPELYNIKDVTSIAVSGSHLVVGCGEDGLKVFSIY